MTTLTTAQEGRRTFILSMAASLALLATVGLMSTLSDAARPAPVLADQTPPGVRDAVIIPVSQYDSVDTSPVVAVATAEPEAKPAVIKTAEVKAPAKPVRTALALSANSQALPAADEITTVPGHPIKVALAMAPETAEAVR
ncbi:MAG TPA: hypothetical protein VG839_02025 [Asticcacaulis sp.]|nr:hypothetical protein [Asticcacaulis sp.]